MVFPVLLLVMMLLKPNGLFGNYEIPFLRQVLPSAEQEIQLGRGGGKMIDAPLTLRPNAETVLEINGLTKQFGGLRAVDNFDLLLKKGDLNGLIGPNGAGKTTVFNMITGVYIPTAGDIIFRGQEITGVEPFRINQMGISRTFQNIRLFPNLTVLDNVRIAYHPHAGYGMMDGIFRNKKFQDKENELTERAQDFLSIFNLRIARARLPKTCLTVSSAAWRLPAPWRPIRSSCCWMNPLPA